MALSTVKVPASIEPLFEHAQKYVEGYFRHLKSDPTQGTISVNGERYVLVRAASLSVNFFEYLKSAYPAISEPEAREAASIVAYDIAHGVGQADAKNFHQATGVTDPIAKLSTGPIAFAYMGWAKVDIFEESRPVADDSYYLCYDHPNSFEADSWIRAGVRTEIPMCYMNAGYSAGWCQQSFGIQLESREILCRARGDAHCRFIMASPHRIDQEISQYVAAHSELFASRGGQ